MAPFKKILVANRGEIARRVFRTCRERGISTVAVFSEADRDSPHVAEADEAVEIGPPPPRQSYLDITRIVAAAERVGADAIHPGYGFLSERPEFARACEDANLVFIGPPAKAMEVMGDKVRARRAMMAAGVPVVPGEEDVTSIDQLHAAAKAIGFPLMIKASAGGGGKGMRIVREAQALAPSFEAAAREAMAAFGDGRVFVERAIESVRHVEIQVMADAHGEVVHLGERDCSVQRRNQKVIEEAPSPSPQMGPAVRQSMGEVAIAAAKAVQYVGAGTVEFLFEQTLSGPRFFFLEMNTRLQVEHPVTEAITGRDLVWDQIRVAAGEPLGFSQSDVRWRGHALECRIYAEDPVTFLPRPGLVRFARFPHIPGVRVDAAVCSNSKVPLEYDPMIAKVVAWGPDRATAIARMRAALQSTVLLGVQTNLALHARILAEPDFVQGTAITTRYIDNHAEQLAIKADLVDGDRARAIAAAAALRSALESPSTPGGRPSASAWKTSVRWRG